MNKTRILDDIADRLNELMPDGADTLQQDLKKNLRAIVEGGIARLDLVSREEFDAQQAVLARTRAKLDALEKQLAELEQEPEKQ